MPSSRLAAEQVALGRAPVLAVDAADAVAATAEAHPDRQPGREQALDRLEGERIADQRQRLEQDQVGRLVLEDAREQVERAAALG
jgi:hypothetical protein